ncbi:hypothetical protein PUN28_004730 [Cardiocondyla obscurior]|uniref:Uncharacterized protein n=1 Tax=Cardiocondyla obscurior TaxID=286306 RepID=A0AAW2GHG0_9HYME
MSLALRQQRRRQRRQRRRRRRRRRRRWWWITITLLFSPSFLPLNGDVRYIRIITRSEIYSSLIERRWRFLEKSAPRKREQRGILFNFLFFFFLLFSKKSVSTQFLYPAELMPFRNGLGSSPEISRNTHPGIPYAGPACKFCNRGQIDIKWDVL